MAEGDEYWTATQEVLQGAEPLVKKPKVHGAGMWQARIFGGGVPNLRFALVPARVRLGRAVGIVGQ